MNRMNNHNDEKKLPPLPKGWVWIRVDDTIKKIPTTNKKLKKRDYLDKGKLPVIDQGQEFIGGYTNKEELKINCNVPAIIFGDHTKIIKFVNFDFVPGADGVKVIRPLEAFSPKLFYYFLHALTLPEKGYARHFQYLVKAYVPLPPLPEQHRIVAKIEELFTRLDAGVKSLKKVKEQLKWYRQSVLKAAMEGKLTEEWRKQHKNELEPASLLLEKIKEERKKKLGNKYKELPPVDTEDLPELPEGWVWTRLGNVTDLTSGRAFKKKEYSIDGIRLLQIANVSFGKIIWDKIAYLPSDYIEKYPELALKTGDVLMALNRPILESKLKIGELKERDAPAILYQRVGRFDFYGISMKPYFLYYLQSPFFLYNLKVSLQGVDQPFVNKPKLLNIPLSLPSLLEQRQIVLEIERRFSIIDEMEKTVEQGLKQAERLRQSILKRAFEGKLVPQNPDDEPASVLLERIKEEKAKRQNKKYQMRLNKHVK